MNFYNFNNFPVVQFWSFFEDPHILTIGTLWWRRIPDWVPIATETRIFRMYGSDAGQPPRSLYTKGLKPLCDTLYICMMGPHKPVFPEAA